MDLTKREKQVLTLMAKGLEEKQIAGEKRVTVSTIKSYKRSIFERLGAVNSANAVAIAKDKGLI